MKNVICTLIVLTAMKSVVAQTYTPIAVTGFNLDAVAETYPNSLATTTQALDQVVSGGNSVMYTTGFAASAGFTGGIPNNGLITSGTKTFQLEPYTGNNALFAPSSTSNTLTLVTPAQYSSVSLLVFSTEGSSTINVIFNYTDLTSSNVGNYTVQDWFNGTNAVLSGIGRCKRVVSGVTNDGVPTNPRFYGINVNIPCAGQQKVLASITINGVTSNAAGGGGYVMAVSGESYTPATASVAYAANIFCQQTAAYTPTVTGTTGGTFSSVPAGLNLNSSTGAINFAASTANTYSVTYTIPGSCPVSTTNTVAVVSSPALTVATPTICPSVTTTLSAIPSIAGGTYTWIPSNQSTQTISVAPATTTNYTVMYSVSGCSATTTATVYVNNSLTIAINNASVCPGEATVLTPTVSTGGGTFLWSPGNQTTPLIAVSPTASSNYTVLYTSPSSCTVQAVATVIVKPTPTVSINSVSVCAGQAALLTSNVLPSGGTYTWSPGGQTTSQITETPSATSGYSLTYEVNGCTASAVGQIIINTPPVVVLSSDGNNLAPMETVVLTATGGGTYQWSTGQSGSVISVNPVQTSVYCATVTSAEGCQVSDCIEITVTGQSTLYFPNVFTPNGDGVNDVYFTPAFNLLNYDLRIYNRWGELMFHTTDPEKGWDGSFQGKTATTGVYVYILKAKGADDIDYNKSGHITLLN